MTIGRIFHGWSIALYLLSHNLLVNLLPYWHLWDKTWPWLGWLFTILPTKNSYRHFFPTQNWRTCPFMKTTRNAPIIFSIHPISVCAFLLTSPSDMLFHYNKRFLLSFRITNYLIISYVKKRVSRDSNVVNTQCELKVTDGKRKAKKEYLIEWSFKVYFAIRWVTSLFFLRILYLRYLPAIWLFRHRRVVTFFSFPAENTKKWQPDFISLPIHLSQTLHFKDGQRNIDPQRNCWCNAK